MEEPVDCSEDLMGWQAKLRSFINDELQVDSYDIAFGNVHRLGPKFDPKRIRRPRPIVAKFVLYDDLVCVKKAAKNLKGKPFWISEQYPPEIEETRKRLYPIAKEERKKKSRVSLIRDKLYVNGNLVELDPNPIESTPPHSTSRPNKRSRKSSTPNGT